MSSLRSLLLGRQNLIILISLLIAFFPLFEGERDQVEANLTGQSFPQLIFYQENSLAQISNPTNPGPKAVGKIRVVVTGYSSTPWETDGDPYITAAGTRVREGIVANNYLPIGTKIRIPELFGEKIFVIEDRMSWKKGNYHVDIWFPSYWEALNFGVKRTYIEILES